MHAFARRSNALLLGALLLAAGGCQEPQQPVLLLVDQNAGPNGCGAVFRLNPGKLEVQLL